MTFPGLGITLPPQGGGSTDASDLSSGTLPDARLSSNVPTTKRISFDPTVAQENAAVAIPAGATKYFLGSIELIYKSGSGGDLGPIDLLIGIVGASSQYATITVSDLSAVGTRHFVEILASDLPLVAGNQLSITVVTPSVDVGSPIVLAVIELTSDAA